MSKARVTGFTLIELIIGIVVFGVVLALITSLVAPQASRSVEPIYQVRATELAQSLLNEIMGKSFDEQSDRMGGMLRCGDPGAATCTLPANMGPDGEDRDVFDDIDDYNGLNLSGGDISNSLGEPLVVAGTNLYEGFSARILVAYDLNMDGLADGAVGVRKLVRVTVTTPAGDDLVFSAYRSNY